MEIIYEVDAKNTFLTLWLSISQIHFIINLGTLYSAKWYEWKIILVSYRLWKNLNLGCQLKACISDLDFKQMLLKRGTVFQSTTLLKNHDRLWIFLTHWSRANFTKNSIWQFQTWLNALLVLNAIYVSHTICSQYSYPLKSYY